MVSAGKLILLSALLCASACSRSAPVDRGFSSSPEKVDGKFALVPSATGEQLILREDGMAELKSEEGMQKGLYALDQTSFRFRFESGDYGIFLRSAFHPREWRGLFRDEVRILKRLEGAKNLDPAESRSTVP